MPKPHATVDNEPEAKDQDKPEDKDEQKGKSEKPEDETADDENKPDESDKKDEQDEGKPEGEESEEGDEKDKGENPKANKGAEKRINELVAKLKEVQADNAELREEVKEFRDQIDRQEDKIRRELPQYYGYINGVKMLITDMSDEQYRDAKKALRNDPNVSAEDKLNTITLYDEAREEYKKRMAPVEARRAKADEEDKKIWYSDWAAVEKEIRDLDPRITKEQVEKVRDQITKDLEEDEFLFDRLKRGPVQKFKHTLKVMEKLGISTAIEEDDYKEERSTQEGASLGKGKSTPAKAPPKFTLDSIRKMSLKDYEKNEPAIKEWFKERAKKAKK